MISTEKYQQTDLDLVELDTEIFKNRDGTVDSTGMV